MLKAEQKLKEYNMSVYHREYNSNSDDPDDYYPIDFSIEDGEDNVAWAWGHSYSDTEVECNHPYECVEYGDDDEQGECKLCGAKCDWHWSKEWLDEGHDEYGGCIGREVEERVITDWHMPRYAGGLIGEYVKELEQEL